MEVTVITNVESEGKYCATSCRHLRGARQSACSLHGKDLERCLGGGPLRCAECIAAAVLSEANRIAGEKHVN